MAVLKGGSYVAGDFSVAGISYAGAWSFLATAATSSPGNFFRSTSTPAPTGTTNACYDGYFYATRVYNSVWGDIADFISVEDSTDIQFGCVYCYSGKEHHKSQRYASPGIVGIASDTYGFGVGQKQHGKQIPIAIGGFVLAYVDRVYKSGTALTSGENGTLKRANMIVKLFFPERIIATFYKKEAANTWHDLIVDGRHWVKVK